MNRSNFNQTGGYPLKTERLQEFQTAFQILNAFGSLAGNLTIISGCTTVGTTVSDGFVYIDNELLEFRSGVAAVDSTVIIIEEPVNRAFENGTVKEVHTIRYATFGTADVSWLWSEFKRPVETKTIPQDLSARLTLIEKKLTIFQAGGAVFPWRKPIIEIPPGFQEVVDIRGRMIVGYDPDQPEFRPIGKADGNKTKQLTMAELPSHSFTYKKPVDGRKYRTDGGGDAPLDSLVDAQTNTLGSDQAFSLMNPYRVAMYIEFIG